MPPTREQRAAWGRKGAQKVNESRTPEERQRAARTAYQARTPEQRKAWAAKGGKTASERMGAEGRSARSRRAREAAGRLFSREQYVEWGRLGGLAVQSRRPPPPPKPQRCATPGCREMVLLRGRCDSCFRAAFRPPRHYLGVNR